MREDALQVRLAHGVKYAAAAAPFDEPQCRLRRVLRGRGQAVLLSNLGEIFARQRGIPFAQGDRDVLRVAAAALRQDDLGRRRLDLRACRWVFQPLDGLLKPAFHRPCRKQRRLNRSARRSVWILVHGRIDAARSRLVDQLQSFDALAPVGLADDLVV